MLQIAIVNDAAIAIEALRRAIAAEHHLLWVARTGAEAVAHCAVAKPDLILMDINMPQLDGVAATRQIMQQSPCAILIVTATLTRHTAQVFEAMGYGALDVVQTPSLGSGDPQALQRLRQKIATIAKLMAVPSPRKVNASPPVSPVPPTSRSLPALVVIGASTGGPAALQQLFSQLPFGFNAAIVVIQHIDQQFAPGLVQWLNQSSRLPIALAQNGDRPQAGKVLIAGENQHLVLRPNQSLRYTHEPRELTHQPAVDVFFESVARYWPQPGIALLLTGMGRDGAVGMQALRSRQWHTIAQSEASCVVFGMPKAAIAQGGVNQVLSLEQMVAYLNRTMPLP
ncbi:MAG: chemotaxis-specific protein-glutamate methyltransferase CheB [Spirulina sp. SIO3F2]|nr:chemotaxis-specific protein-glutamate methyltransferase CheB [Spirulina sp. SIO3F2]